MLPTSTFLLGLVQAEAKEIDEEYFAQDISPILAAGRTVTVTLSLTIETTSVVEITKDGTNWEDINDGTAITANKEFIHKFAAVTGDTINFRSKTAGTVRRAIVQADSQEGPANSSDLTLSDAEVEAAYNNQVAIVSQAQAEAGTLTDVKRWTPERVKQAIDALASAGMSDLVDDLTPQLGGNLDLNDFAIVAKTSPASTGVMRLANNTKIVWRNASNSADGGSIYLDSSNNMIISLGGNFSFGANFDTLGKDIRLSAANIICLGTGVEFGTQTSQKLAFYGSTPIVQPTALTASDTNVPNSGDVTTDNIIANLQTRVDELESKLQALGLLA